VRNSRSNKIADTVILSFKAADRWKGLIPNHDRDERVVQSISATNIEISQRAVIENYKIEVDNYLDEHAVIHNSVIDGFSIKKLQKAFPEIDKFTLKAIEAEWRTARQRMLNLEFDEEDFK
jgi:hypothetical protein